jgi:hypothetical protein
LLGQICKSTFEVAAQAQILLGKPLCERRGYFCTSTSLIYKEIERLKERFFIYAKEAIEVQYQEHVVWYA